MRNDSLAEICAAAKPLNDSINKALADFTLPKRRLGLQFSSNDKTKGILTFKVDRLGF